MARRKLTQREVALRYGFKSGLEERNAQLLNRLGVPFEYETQKIKYKINRNATYRPDFILENGIIVELCLLQRKEQNQQGQQDFLRRLV